MLYFVRLIQPTTLSTNVPNYAIARYNAFYGKLLYRPNPLAQNFLFLKISLEGSTDIWQTKKFNHWQDIFFNIILFCNYNITKNQQNWYQSKMLRF